MPHIHSFPPIESPTSRTLILGTMPGKASLRERQYYAHPQNVFWRIVGEVLGFDSRAPYEARVAGLMSSDVALWDVLKSCTRESSLDSDIDDETIVTNDFAAFFERHNQVRRIFFNGTNAEAHFQRHVMPALATHSGFELVRLPSTSPANARVPLAEKVHAWRAIAGPPA